MLKKLPKSMRSESPKTLLKSHPEEQNVIGTT